jgi:two-component system, cell cycle sensor histidine kinase and response regulator CckA
MQTALENPLIVLDTIPEAYIRLDRDLRLTFLNQAAQSSLGKSREDLRGKSLLAVFPPGAAACLSAAIRRAFESRSVVAFDVYDESRGHWYAVAAMPDAAGGIVVRFSEAGSRRNGGHARSHEPSPEQELLENEKLYRQLFEVESDALVLVDHESGRILAANAAAAALYGYTREELLSLNRVDLSAEPDRTLQATTEKQAFIPLRWHKKKNGKVFPVEISGRYFDLKGRSVFVSAIRDITERRVMQEALEKSEEKFSRAFHGNPAAITILDLKSGFYLEVNETFEQLSGYRRDEVVGHSWADFCILVDHEFRDRAVAQLLSKGRLRNWELHFRRKNGDVGVGLLSAELIEIGGRPCAITATVDITDRIRLEGELRQAQKLESVGRLAGGVAHDFNNLLTVINGYSECILGMLRPQDPLYSPAQEIKKAGERAAGLTKQLLAFSRKQVIEPQTLDVNGVVRETSGMLRRLIGEDIELVTTLDPLLGSVLADPDQIHQVIMNLVVNARDAMPDGGQLEISTKNVDINEKATAAHPDSVPGRYVMLVVADSGVGMSEEILPSIFDPFFTTREQGKGTGLGLATVYGIVRQSGGWIEVSTKVGHGASFAIYLPRIDGLPVSAPAPTAAKATLSGCETVLIVEDQEEVRGLTNAVLKAYGYRVLDAANAAAALALAAEHPDEIDLLLTDVILPGMNGRELADRMQAQNPRLKVLFTSGYSADVIARRGVLEPDVAYLPKPFNAESLAAKVRQVLS